MLPVIAFPAIDPIALQLGPLAIRWYALAYITGLILGWRYMLRMTKDMLEELATANPTEKWRIGNETLQWYA